MSLAITVFISEQTCINNTIKTVFKTYMNVKNNGAATGHSTVPKVAHINRITRAKCLSQWLLQWMLGGAVSFAINVNKSET